MRLLIYGLNFYPELTGVGKYTAELAAWLASRGHKVRIVCAPPYYPAWALQPGFNNRWARERWRPDGVTVEVCRCPLWVPAKPRAWKRLLHLVSFAASSLPVLLGQIGWRPDALMIIAPTFACAPAAIAFAKLARCRTWLHIQDFELDAAVGSGMFEHNWLARIAAAGERALLRRFDVLSTISGQMLVRLRAKSGRSKGTVLFTNSIDVKHFPPTAGESIYRAEFDCKSKDILVLYSGSIGEKQGLETLLDAAAILVRRPCFRFVVCGEGSAKEVLAERYANLSNVAWKPLQPAERLVELLAAADIHALPQRAGVADLVMPSKLIGMMASGKPVVATAAPDTEIWNVLQGRGVVVPPGDAQALADAIERLASSPELGARYGMAARAYVEENFDQDKVLRAFEAQLLELVKESR